MFVYKSTLCMSLIASSKLLGVSVHSVSQVWQMMTRLSHRWSRIPIQFITRSSEMVLTFPYISLAVKRYVKNLTLSLQLHTVCFAGYSVLHTRSCEEPHRFVKTVDP